MLVVSQQLKVKDVRLGWFVAGFSNGTVIYEHSMVHFAPTHPLVLALYAPRDKSETKLYPPDQDSLRSDFIDKLKNLSSFDRCQGSNCAVLPEQFESYRGDTAVDDKTHSFAFVAQYSPVGFIPADKIQESDLNQNVVYVFRFIGDGVDHVEFPQSEMKSRYGTEQLNELLTPHALLRLFDQ